MPNAHRVVSFLLFCCLSWAGWAAAEAPQAATPPPREAKKPQESDYDLYKMLVDTIDQVERNYVTEVNRRELIEAAVRGVLSKLDPYSSYVGRRTWSDSKPAWRASSAALGFTFPRTTARCAC